LLYLNSFVIGGSAFNSTIILDSTINCFIICGLLVKRKKKSISKKKGTKLTPFKYERDQTNIKAMDISMIVILHLQATNHE